MRVIKPVNVATDDILTASSVAEPDAFRGERLWELRPDGVPYQLTFDASQDVKEYGLRGAYYNGALNKYYIFSRSPSDANDWYRQYTYDANYSKVASDRLSLVFRSQTHVCARNTESGAKDVEDVFYSTWHWRPNVNYTQDIHKYTNGVETKLPSITTSGDETIKGFTCAQVGGVFNLYTIIDDGNANFSIAKSNADTAVREQVIPFSAGGAEPIAIDYYAGEFYIMFRHPNAVVKKYSSSFAFIEDVLTLTTLQANTLFNDGENFFIASNITENGVPAGAFKAYNVLDFTPRMITPPGSEPDYEIGERVILKETHKLYEATAVTRDKPTDGINAVPPTWVEVSATNKYRAFDESITTATSGESPLIMEITPGAVFDSVVGLNIQGVQSVVVTVTDPVHGEVYNKTIALNDESGVVDWYSYLWSGFSFKTQFALFDLPLFADATIKVELIGQGEVSIGALVSGASTVLGQANYGTSIQQLDFSTVDEDAFGNLNITKRPGAKLVNYDVSVQKTQLDYVYRELEKLSGVATVWSGTDNVQDETLVYGYHRDNNLNLDTPTLCKVTIQVRGLI